MLQITDMPTWISDNSDRIYGFNVYRRLYTPYEQEYQFLDESQFEDDEMTYGYIREAVKLGHGDWLLGFQCVYDDGGCAKEDDLEYYRMSDIRLYTNGYMQRLINEDAD